MSAPEPAQYSVSGLVGALAAGVLVLVGAFAVVSVLSVTHLVGWLALFGVLGGLGLVAIGHRLAERSLPALDPVSRALVFVSLPFPIVLMASPLWGGIPEWITWATLIPALLFAVAVVASERKSKRTPRPARTEIDEHNED
jgi:hypothetical protein